MFLSVVVPAYNCEKYIEHCIKSIMTQNISRDDYEVIIVNDGSTDTTLEKISALRLMYPNIKCVTTENKGQAAARNYAISLSNAEYVIFMDSDDYIAENVFGKLKDIAYTYNPELIYYGASVINTYTQNTFEEAEHVLFSTGQECFGKESIDNGVWAWCVKRSVLEKYGMTFIEGRYCEDGMFTAELFSKVGETVYWHSRPYKYVLNSTGTMRKNNRTHHLKLLDDFEFCVYRLKEICDNFRDDGDVDFINALTNRYYSFVFLLTVRLVKYADVKLGREVVKRLQKNGVYPCKWKPYKKLSVWVTYFILNNKALLIFMIWIFECKRKLTKDNLYNETL